MTGKTCARYPPWTGATANRESAPAISASPATRTLRAPNRADSRSVNRTDSVPITVATGRKASPIRSGL